MFSHSRDFVTLAVCTTTIAIGARAIIANPIHPVEIECGANGAGSAGTLVVQLGRTPTTHGKVTVVAERNDAQWTEVSVGIGESCGAVAPGHFRVNATPLHLNGATLRVSANRVIPVELWDSTGKVIVSKTGGKTAVLEW